MFKQRVGRTLDRAGPSQAAKHPPHQRRLADPELPRKGHQHARRKARRKACSRASGRLGVGQEGAKLFYNRHHFFAKRRRSRAATSDSALDFSQLARDIVIWGRELGFAELGIADTELSADEARLGAGLDAGRHGEMDYMARHGARRARPSEVVPGTIRVITARLDYLPRGARDPDDVLHDSRKAYVSRYALGRDYHKVMRQRLQRLGDSIRDGVESLVERPGGRYAP